MPTCLHICMHTSVCTWMYACVCTSTYVHEYMQVSLCVFVLAWQCICIHANTSTHVFANILSEVY